MDNIGLSYFMTDTNKKIDEVRSDMRVMRDSLEDLQKFKVQMLTSSKWVSIIISTAIGAITFIATAVTSYLWGSHGHSGH